MTTTTRSKTARAEAEDLATFARCRSLALAAMCRAAGGDCVVLTEAGRAALGRSRSAVPGPGRQGPQGSPPPPPPPTPGKGSCRLQGPQGSPPPPPPPKPGKGSCSRSMVAAGYTSLTLSELEKLSFCSKTMLLLMDRVFSRLGEGGKGRRTRLSTPPGSALLSVTPPASLEGSTVLDFVLGSNAAGNDRVRPAPPRLDGWTSSLRARSTPAVAPD
jgi:hypothetical protein